MPLRDLFRRKRRSRHGERVNEHGLSEDDVQRLQRGQRAARSSVKVVRRDQ